MEVALFWIFSMTAVVAGVGVVANVRNTINAALSLVVTMLALAGLYFLLHAEFVGLIQVLVYAGAIVVLFLFVIMLLNLRGGALGGDSQPLMKIAGGLLLGAGAFKLSMILAGARSSFPEVDASYGTTRAVAEILFTDYVLVFELAGVLLLAGIVAAVALAKRSLD
ncbi:MAG: NADH-quinone oxidoreductase subunit J [bacterium]|nr:NADH-quinone oxidoreductase subunit J [bacterium]